ncbi:helix-turn-helix domain-containing protein [Geobacillus sp. BK01]|uniref:helix-turn-helix domain-containing protein n=1 Tax=Geobacillus sp. BK01 TaxID=3457328 RepID=UPI003FA538B5
MSEKASAQRWNAGDKETDLHMKILLESFRTITSTLELDEVLNKIMLCAFTMFRSTDAGYIQLFDEQSEKLIVRAYVGFNDRIRSFRVSIGESIVGKVFRDGCVRMLRTTKEIYDQMADLSEENFHILHSAIESKKTVQSLLSVPITYGEKRIGVMTLHRFEKEEQPGERDLLLLQSFASHVAIAIHNAQLHEEVQKNLDEVTCLLNKLESTNKLLQKRMGIHNHLTKISIENKGLDSIIMEMNSLMGKTVVFADYLEGKCYPSDSLSIEKVMADLFVLFKTRTKPAYARISDFESFHYIYPIRSASAFLGCLIVEGDAPLSIEERLVLEQGAPILTMEVMKNLSRSDVLYRKTYEKYHEFLKIKNPIQAEAAIRELGMSIKKFIQTVVIELYGNSDPYALANDARSFVTRMQKVLPPENRLVMSYNNKIVLFSTTSNEHDQSKWIDLVKKMVDDWNKRFTVAVRAGVSTGIYYHGYAEENHNKAEKALLYLKKQNKKGVFHFHEMGIGRLFLHHHPSEMESFLSETLSLLWTDQETYQELLHTLISYVQSGRSMSATAKKLHIHPNTLYHRIKKIEGLLGLDFDNYEDYLSVQLAVYLYSRFYHIADE